MHCLPTYHRPWYSNIDPDRVCPNTEYYCVHNWGSFPLRIFPGFMRLTSKINQEQLEKLPPEEFIGYAVGVSPYHLRPSAETLTVWTCKEHMENFYRSGIHKMAMEKYGRYLHKDFQLYKCLVSGGELPTAGDMDSTLSFIRQIKQTFMLEVPARRLSKREKGETRNS